ncbi:uncharacterized protein GGS22DRAFT_138596 [Annulohypoxylon maeteangense]|uniref:uncharacterized protein n=1 Tax=Annulohypoxylon maeteangense TaxID=1927788 RepID=UPI002008D6B5|nr:uncharacterized protein GGS22DRAFT_138596 [Annulohypoxylon maeteangense]KAI0885086.1 hypothetical protein GGS22DRAFT_138596 [Annulohypoxylon maeteangense]
MRELLGSIFVGLAALTILAPAAIATGDEGYQIHQWGKDYDLFRHPKRDASCQQSNYYLCSASVNGGCCPEGYACAVSSCYATTGGPTSACGRDGYYNCPLNDGPGGCCPTGYICNKSGCQPPAGSTVSQTCQASFFACTSSPYGCCPNGMTCGSYTCYGPPKTYAVSDTVTTTNSRGDTITTVVTSTTVLTPGTSATSAATAANVPKLVASTVSKLPSIETGTSSGGGGGLSSSQIGGIIGGAVALLVVIVAIAALVIWQLKRTEKATKAAAGSRLESSSDQPRSQKSGFEQTTISEVDGMDADSVARARNAHFRSLSDDSTVGGRSQSQTPNLWGSNASSTPPAWQGDFSRFSPPNPPDNHDNGMYPQRVSVDSQGTHTHARQVSNTSELDGSANSISELGANDDDPGRRRSNSMTQTPISHVRRSSDPSGSSRGARDNNNANTTIGNPLGPLAEVNELHGYYGSPDLAVGQTAAKLYQKNPSASSLGHGSQEGKKDVRGNNAQP